MPTPSGLAHAWRSRSSDMSRKAVETLKKEEGKPFDREVLAKVSKLYGMADALVRCANDIESSGGGWQEFDDEEDDG